MYTTVIILSIVMILVGLIVLVFGVIFYSQNNKNNLEQPWYVWLYLIGGIVLAILGAILFGWAVVQGNKEQKQQMIKAAEQTKMNLNANPQPPANLNLTYGNPYAQADPASYVAPSTPYVPVNSPPPF